jgi:hypothetical protein
MTVKYFDMRGPVGAPCALCSNRHMRASPYTVAVARHREAGHEKDTRRSRLRNTRSDYVLLDYGENDRPLGR